MRLLITGTTVLVIVIVFMPLVSSLNEIFVRRSGYDAISQTTAGITLPYMILCADRCLSDRVNCTAFVYTNHTCYLYDHFGVDPQPNATHFAYVKTSAENCFNIWSYSSSLALSEYTAAEYLCLGIMATSFFTQRFCCVLHCPSSCLQKVYALVGRNI